MPAALPIIGMIASFAVSSLLAPDAPNAPDPAPAPPPPTPAPAPAAPEAPAAEATISPEDAQAAAKIATNRRKRANAAATDVTALGEDAPSSYTKTLLGE